MEADYKITAKDPVFHGKTIERVYWSKDRQFLISDQWIYLPAGWAPELVITGWDPIRQKYRVTNILPNATYVSFMTLDGGGQRFEEIREGQRITRTWVHSEETSPGKKTFRVECSVDKGPKWSFCEGTSTKRTDE